MATLSNRSATIYPTYAAMFISLLLCSGKHYDVNLRIYFDKILNYLC